MALNFLLLVYLLFHHLPLPSLASAPGTLAFFLDEECIQASIINPSVHVPAETCLVTPGALGIAVQTFPPCPSGNTTVQMYHDTSCANPVNMDLQYDNCYFNGPNGVTAIVFACKGEAVSATSTAAAGSSTIPVAVDSPSTPSSGATTEQTAPASNGATATSTSPPSSTSTSPNTSQTSTSTGGTGSGLSQRTQIIIGVVIPVIAIVVAFLAWWFPRRSGRK